MTSLPVEDAPTGKSVAMPCVAFRNYPIRYARFARQNSSIHMLSATTSGIDMYKSDELRAIPPSTQAIRKRISFTDDIDLLTAPSVDNGCP